MLLNANEPHTGHVVHHKDGVANQNAIVSVMVAQIIGQLHKRPSAREIPGWTVYFRSSIVAPLTTPALLRLVRYVFGVLQASQLLMSTRTGITVE